MRGFRPREGLCFVVALALTWTGPCLPACAFQFRLPPIPFPSARAGGVLSPSRAGGQTVPGSHRLQDSSGSAFTLVLSNATDLAPLNDSTPLLITPPPPAATDLVLPPGSNRVKARAVRARRVQDVVKAASPSSLPSLSEALASTEETPGEGDRGGALQLLDFAGGVVSGLVSWIGSRDKEEEEEEEEGQRPTTVETTEKGGLSLMQLPALLRAPFQVKDPVEQRVSFPCCRPPLLIHS
jgi:hypothetical protein